MAKHDHTRRRLLGAGLSALGLGALDRPMAHAANLVLTPHQSTGPFYPITLPLDKDNDLVTVAGATGIARGEIGNVLGRLVDESGRPVADARIEIWQCNSYGRYHHPGDRRDAPLDPNFQSYGQFVTGADGTYRFRTIKPVPYPGRAPHIHFAISGPGFERLTTQMYMAGAPDNARDFLLNRITDSAARKSVVVDFKNDTATNGWRAQFDIVLTTDGRFS